jgi:RNA recognition motif-containing protein
MNRRIYVGNLQWGVTDADLREVFGRVGGIESCEVVHGPDGKSRGFGFIEFITEEDAVRAVNSLHKESLKGRQMVVQHATPKKNREDANHARPGARRWA